MSQIFANRQYEELKIELKICKIGGLFVAIYETEYIIESIISKLQEDMPECFHFQLQMTDEKLIFPIFFSQTFEYVGQQSNIFHVLEIEKLSKNSQNEFIQSLQYGREQFKSHFYSLVFWVKPDFINLLFHIAPDFHHWIFSTYDFRNYQEVSNNSYVKKENDFLKNIDEYLKKLVWEYEHWQEVKDSGEDFRLEVMSRANLLNFYIHMFCRNWNGDIRLIDDVFEEFLQDKHQSFMTLLGDFGTGKSSFSLYYFITQAKKYLLDKFYRIPLFISLKDYPKKLDIQTFIKNEFIEKFKLSFSLSVFQKLMIEGKFIFFIDGFDEMISISNKYKTLRNFKELKKLTFEHLQFMTLSNDKLKNKIFLTCRTHYFFTETQEKEILKADYPVLYRNYVTKSHYQITRIYIQKFNEEQIKTFILKNIKNETATEKLFNIINDTYNLKELANRPLLLEMIVKTLPNLKSKQQINAADLYHAYTNDWIERDDWRSQMTPYGKRLFMWELALKMYQKGGDFSIHHSQFDMPKYQFFKSNMIEPDDISYHIYETTTCSFLNRDLSGNYKFIHKSFMEYFISEYFFDTIKNDKIKSIEYVDLNNEIKYFLKTIISSNKYNLNGLDLSNLTLDKVYLAEGLLLKANLKKTELESANLSNAILEGANFESANLSDANLEGTNFENANLSNANLEGANFENANLSNANLGNANIEGANLKKAVLKKANLGGANLEWANLEDADLEDADLEGASLIGANIQDALKGASIELAILHFAI